MIELKNTPEIKKMVKGGKIASFAMREIARHIKPGITTLELDKIAYRIVRARGAHPSFLNYQGFPGSICVSVNDQIVHGIPSNRKLEWGDFVKIDIGVLYDGFHTDMTRTFALGKISKRKKKIIETCQKALDAAIDCVLPGNTIGDIEHEIGRVLKSGDLSPVMSLTGHGIGRNLHEEPSIFCDGTEGSKDRLIPGMVIAIEPIATAGNGKVRKGPDGWTIVSADGSLSVHFEDTVVVTNSGHKVLTRQGKIDNMFL